MTRKKNNNSDNHVNSMSRKRPLPVEILKRRYDYEDTENAENETRF